MKLYEKIACFLFSINTCRKDGNNERLARQTRILEALVKERLPSGGGFDAGTQLDFERSNPNKLVFTTSFHLMDENGHYDGWTDHTVIVTPSLLWGIEIEVLGEDRNGVCDYIADVFQHVLNEEVDQ